MDAAQLERRRLRDPGLRPGMTGKARGNALAIARENERVTLLARIWRAMARSLDGPAAASGNLVIRDTDPAGQHRLELRDLCTLHESLRGKPILHLDATLRPELVRTILPDLEIDAIDVAAPHMHLRHIGGSFGKSMLCPEKGLADAETARRTNRLQECVDYVRWHARRVFPARALVVSYQAIESAFAGIANVETAHFNAVAGLDIYKDVALLISIGRPLPSTLDLHLRAGAYFGVLPNGRYGRARTGIRMQAGPDRSLPVLRHDDAKAEILRAAICDDELIQVIGRGRGVNRTAENPLEVHVLADVALPLVYDRLTAWDVERPDIIQRMLLDGITVDSPADAAALHPALFDGENQAKLAFARAGFKGQTPMYSSYREMTLKSAAYKRAGRGRGWQRAWWVGGNKREVRQHMEAVLGIMTGWRPD